MSYGSQYFSRGIVVVLQVPKNEFVRGIPRPQHLICTSRIALEFEPTWCRTQTQCICCPKVGFAIIGNSFRSALVPCVLGVCQAGGLLEPVTTPLR
jgi:hypothetical protein